MLPSTAIRVDWREGKSRQIKVGAIQVKAECARQKIVSSVAGYLGLVMRQLNPLQRELLTVDRELGVELLNGLPLHHRIRQMDGALGMRLRSGSRRVDEEIHFPAGRIIIARYCQHLRRYQHRAFAYWR